MVGKETTQRTEKVRDTVRRTEVEVERLGEGEAPVTTPTAQRLHLGLPPRLRDAVCVVGRAVRNDGAGVRLRLSQRERSPVSRAELVGRGERSADGLRAEQPEQQLGRR